MKLKISFMMLLFTITCIGFSADTESAEAKLPPKDTTLYWNIRSEAVSELIPFLTSKRTELKKKTQFLADYLLKIDKATEFVDSDVKDPEDMKYYVEVLNLTKNFNDANIPIPEKRPTWDELVEIAMQHVMFEGYMPTEIEGETEMLMFQELCKKKEEYGRKVRKDVHDVLTKGVRIWIYLGTINEQGNAKALAADMILEKKAMDAEQKAQLTAAKREASMQREQAKIDQKNQDAMSRAS
ncbi:MAG: hypothetical protein ACYSUT_08635, partial [Planctomycetota bacterium]